MPEEQNAPASKNCKQIFLATFAAIVPYGDFYKLKEAERFISTSDLKAKKKDKMLKVLKLVPRKKSLYLAFKESKIRDRDEVLRWFVRLNVSSITISKREGLKHLKNLYE